LTSEFTAPTEHRRAAAVRWSHRLEFAGFRLAFALFAALPRRIALRAGAWLGELLYFLDARDRCVALFNLGIAFPDRTMQQRRSILRASCRNLGRVAAEFCHLPELSAANVSEVIRFADREAWEHVLDKVATHGAVILTGHLGNTELLTYIHGLLGHPVTLVHHPMSNTLVDRAVNNLRSAVGTRAIPKKTAARAALRTLRAHGILAIPSDQNQTARYGVFVDFFGMTACTTDGVARLARLTGSPVFPVFIVREGESARHRVEVLPEVEMISTGDKEADIRTNTQRCTAIIEDMIRRYPEQWIWFHKRWRTRPAGEDRFY
jgi:Kdo2-lipid IVA lauroyltransferase/acyltransferase